MLAEGYYYHPSCLYSARLKLYLLPCKRAFIAKTGDKKCPFLTKERQLQRQVTLKADGITNENSGL